MKRAIIVHGWGGSPEGGWYSWIKKELENNGFEVIMPAMPDTMNPKINAWIKKLQEVAGEVDEDTYLIGESIGCQAIMRYLEKLPEDEKVGGVIFIAGWFNLTDETWDEEYTKEIAEPWINTPINFEKIKKHTGKLVDIYSDDDIYIPLSDGDIFKEKLNAEIIVLKNKGHFDSTREFPELLDKILEMAT